MARTHRKNRSLELPIVSHTRPMDLTREELRALKRAGYAPPLSARIGRGPMFVVDK